MGRAEDNVKFRRRLKIIFQQIIGTKTKKAYQPFRNWGFQPLNADSKHIRWMGHIRYLPIQLHRAELSRMYP